MQAFSVMKWVTGSQVNGNDIVDERDPSTVEMRTWDLLAGSLSTLAFFFSSFITILEGSDKKSGKNPKATILLSSVPKEVKGKKKM